jgi:hypothetical protein
MLLALSLSRLNSQAWFKPARQRKDGVATKKFGGINEFN